MPLQNELLSKELIAPNTYRVNVYHPKIARKRKAGQFVILRTHEGGERVPLTIVGSDVEQGTVTMIFQAVGHSTKELAGMELGECLMDLAGPLGMPTHIENFGTACVIGGGYGTAPVLPIAQALADAGNEMIGIIGARNKEFVILEKELGEICKTLEVCTDDGTYGRHGMVTNALADMIDAGKKIDFVLAIGPAPMMRAVANLTREHGIKTMVSLNPIMVDGTGMCGGCRVEVNGETKFACVDGPEFDGHQVNFELLMQRQGTYKAEESHVAELGSHCRLDAKLAAEKDETEDN